MIYSPLVSIQSTLKRYQLLQGYATILWEMDFHKSVYIYRYTMFLGHGDRRCHTHMHMYTCMEDVCHTCSSLELASAGTRRLQVLKVCALSVFVSVQQQKSCIEFCGVGLNTIYECKNMYVCLYIYVCISQEPRGVTTACSLLLQVPQSA